MSARIHAALRSGTGCVRSGNEDAWYLNGIYAPLEQMNDEAARQATFPAEGSLFAVCDGVGGERNGEIASSTAVESMKDYQTAMTDEGFVQETQAWIHRLNGKVLESSHGGCTLAMVCVIGNAVRVGHIGDSRVYRLTKGTLQRITRDHSKVQMLMDAGLITPEQAAVHPQRHVITRSLGMDEDDGICTAELAAPLPVISGDRYLICSDGVTDMIPDAQLAEMLSMGKCVDDCAEAIYRAALAAGGKDNTTLIVLEPDFEGEATAPDYLDGDATLVPEADQILPPTDGQPAEPDPLPEGQAAREADATDKQAHPAAWRGLLAVILILVLIAAGYACWRLILAGNTETPAVTTATEQTAEAPEADTPISTADTGAAPEAAEPAGEEAVPTATAEATPEPTPGVTDSPAAGLETVTAVPTTEPASLPVLPADDVRNGSIIFRRVEIDV